MKRNVARILVGIACLVTAAPTVVCAEDPELQNACQCILDHDKEVRALGLEQVREGLKGPEATRRFAALLPQLAPDGQRDLIIALGDRADRVALPAVQKFIASDVPEIRSAAIRAVGALGGKDEAALLVMLLGKPECEADAKAAILCLHGVGVHEALLAQAKQTPAVCPAVFRLLVTRHAVDAVPELLAAANDTDAEVRGAALSALGQLAGPEQVVEMAKMALKASQPSDRAAVERALAVLSARSGKPDACAQPLLALMQTQGPEGKGVLFSALGRIGGKTARDVVFTSLGDADAAVRQAALRALCNWPDGTVAARLAEIATKDDDPANRKMALEALIRVAPLPNDRRRPHGDRSDGERLAMTKKAMELATTRQQKEAILRRAGAIYTMDTLQFVEPYLDQPEFAEAAAEAIVAIAHHKEVRHAHPKEFDEVLGRVIKISKNPKLINEATRYKEDRT